MRLERDGGLGPHVGRDAAPLLDVLGSVVGQRHVAGLAGGAELLEDGHGLLQRRVRVVEVRVVEVDVVGAQARQGFLQGGADVAGCEPAPVRFGGDLGGDDDVVTAPASA